jgi:predicted nucleic acid-binding protein
LIVVDTSVWVDWFGGRDTPEVGYLDACLDELVPIALTDIVLTEILQGLRSDREARRVEESMAAFPVLRLETLDDHRRAASLYRSARRHGVTIRRTLDCLIASVCVREGLPLLHADRDFDHLAAVTDLRIVEPRV